MKNFNWSMLAQFVSYGITALSLLVNLILNRQNLKNLRQIELSKQAFAKENEELKRQQNIQDFKNKTIADFLNAINAYQATHNRELAQKAMGACGMILPLCNEEQKKLINNVIKCMKEVNKYDSSKEAWDNESKAIYEASNAFKFFLDKQRKSA